jgi:hypothetical protein
MNHSNLLPDSTPAGKPEIAFVPKSKLATFLVLTTKNFDGMLRKAHCFTPSSKFQAMVPRIGEKVQQKNVILGHHPIFRKPGKKLPGQRGRPRTRGERLPTPAEIAAKATDWRVVKTLERGKERVRLVIIRHIVWHKVLPGKYIRLVISRDPEGIERDDCFFTTDLQLDAAFLISVYANRWCIEDTFRNGKQFLGIEQPQSWKGAGPEKVAAMGYAIYSLIWAWFIKNGDFKRFPNRPWYKTKVNPSFQDALAGIRHQLWTCRIPETVPNTPEFHKFSKIMIESLSRAA